MTCLYVTEHVHRERRADRAVPPAEEKKERGSRKR